MRINQLRFLVALAKYKTFSRVSKELMVSQPSISTAIKNLEEELGFKILSRSKNKIEFTDAGRAVLDKAEIILHELDEILLLNDCPVAYDLVGKIRIGSSPFFTSNIVLNSVKSLKERFPGIMMEIIQGDNEMLLKKFAFSEIDVAIVLIHKGYADPFTLEMKKNNLFFQRLFNDKMGIVLSASCPLSQNENIDLKDLVDYQYISFNGFFAKYTLNLMKKYGYSKKNVTINDWDYIRKMCLEEQYFTLIPFKIFEDKFMNYGNFKVMSIINFDWKCEVGFLTKSKEPSKIEEIYFHYLKEAKI